jgi:hypothetical protein
MARSRRAQVAQGTENQATALSRGKVSMVTIGKVPGEVKDLTFEGKTTIASLFLQLGMSKKQIANCEIQRNGQAANPEDLAKPGDTIIALGQIRGN